MLSKNQFVQTIPLLLTGVLLIIVSLRSEGCFGVFYNLVYLGLGFLMLIIFSFIVLRNLVRLYNKQIGNQDALKMVLFCTTFTVLSLASFRIPKELFKSDIDIMAEAQSRGRRHSLLIRKNYTYTVILNYGDGYCRYSDDYEKKGDSLFFDNIQSSSGSKFSRCYIRREGFLIPAERGSLNTDTTDWLKIVD